MGIFDSTERWEGPESSESEFWHHFKPGLVCHVLDGLCQSRWEHSQKEMHMSADTKTSQSTANINPPH